MIARGQDYYLALRLRYEPSVAKLVIVAESPPSSGKYFYDPTGSIKEPLFAALMRQLKATPATKEVGLRDFQSKGWVLVDATYHQVDKLPRDADRDRDALIEGDYPLLVEDLSSLLSDRGVPLILIKANVCRILEPRLTKDGFNVINTGRLVYFPSTGQQKRFEQQFAVVLNSPGRGAGASSVS
ncbi:hypothetical protein S58_10580 [Bradyrhizobium oligotrophicum S58]|uniref:Uncharacterized protein n=2 Tax=Bradyrhizobium oligotrophicum TaxID=44255 RepID=M4Z243_9BRAD|nr:hypothetical protein S58_10580 [Bradyrhizobium oligotrophicum S58]